MECTAYAVKLANEKYKFDPPLSIHEIKQWGKQGTRSDVIHEFFKDPDFYRTQPVMQGAKEFVKKLSTMTEVFVSTAIPPEFMGIRAQRIMEEFPEIPADHIYMGARKDKISVDILFDDGMHNVVQSTAAYPILMRRPWNQEATGMLAVNTYDEFLKLVEVIADSYSVKEETELLSEPSIVVFVGPSGSGKSKIATKILEKTDKFEKLTSYTTNDPTAVEENRWYNYVSVDTFRQMCDSGELIDSTMYAGHGYGSRKTDVDAILASGKKVMATMDICGAMSLKTHYKDVVTVYIKRDKRELLKSILEKNSTNEDKVNRIISIDDERRNEEICDIVVENNGDVDEVVNKILEQLF
jgi:guanylate kinase